MRVRLEIPCIWLLYMIATLSSHSQYYEVMLFGTPCCKKLHTHCMWDTHIHRQLREKANLLPYHRWIKVKVQQAIAQYTVHC